MLLLPGIRIKFAMEHSRGRTYHPLLNLEGSLVEKNEMVMAVFSSTTRSRVRKSEIARNVVIGKPMSNNSFLPDPSRVVEQM